MNLYAYGIYFGAGVNFWVIYHLPTSPPPYPISDDGINWSGHTLTWNPNVSRWVSEIDGYKVDWVMHAVIEYPYYYVETENTSIGGIRALFR